MCILRRSRSRMSTRRPDRSSTTGRKTRSPPEPEATMAERKLEVRCMQPHRIEHRQTDGPVNVTGFAISSSEIAEAYPGLLESFQPRAFAYFLAGDPEVFACYAHDTRHLLGRTSSGTVRLEEDV